MVETHNYDTMSEDIFQSERKVLTHLPNTYAAPYQPISLRDWKSPVIFGVAYGFRMSREPLNRQFKNRQGKKEKGKEDSCTQTVERGKGVTDNSHDGGIHQH